MIGAQMLTVDRSLVDLEVYIIDLIELHKACDIAISQTLLMYLIAARQETAVESETSNTVRE